MKRSSSTNQLDLFAPQLTATTGGRETPSATGEELSATVQSARPSTTSETTSEVEFPEFGSYAGTEAEAARIAGRIAASYVSEAEHQAFLRERQSLLDKLFTKEITREEEIRLEYVRWSLDRIEDAEHGTDLDRIEDRINRYERFLEDMDEFKAALSRAAKNRR